MSLLPLNPWRSNEITSTVVSLTPFALWAACPPSTTETLSLLQSFLDSDEAVSTYSLAGAVWPTYWSPTSLTYTADLCSLWDSVTSLASAWVILFRGQGVHRLVNSLLWYVFSLWENSVLCFIKLFPYFNFYFIHGWAQRKNLGTLLVRDQCDRCTPMEKEFRKCPCVSSPWVWSTGFYILACFLN